MYDYEYEEDVLLTLRLLKYLQEESPARAQEAVEAFKTLVPEDPYEFIEYTFGTSSPTLHSLPMRRKNLP